MSGKAILVVEDDIVAATALRNKLSDLGYATHPIVMTGECAVADASRLKPDLILMDIGLAGTIDGIEAAQQIQEKLDIPVIYLTAHADDEHLNRAKTTAPYGFIVKPPRGRELSIMIEMTLHRHALERQIKTALADLRRLELLRDEIGQMVVHDMRTPLMAISGGLELVLSSDHPLPGDQREELTMAFDATMELVEMVSSLLDISRFEADEIKLKLSESDLLNAVKSVMASLELIAKERGLKVSVAGRPVSLKMDVELIKRVLGHLLRNAMRLSPSHGAVSVAVAKEKGAVRVSVTDSGRAVPEQYRDQIFDMGGAAEARHAGCRNSTGMGLAFCKLAVEAHGGKIGVATAEGGGNAFWFSLPTGLA